MRAAVMGAVKTLSGRVLTEELIEAIAREAEAGFEPGQLHPLTIRRASGDEESAFRIQFHVDRATFDVLLARAEKEHRGVGEIARLALECYLDASSNPATQETQPSDAAASAE